MLRSRANFYRNARGLFALSFESVVGAGRGSGAGRGNFLMARGAFIERASARTAGRRRHGRFHHSAPDGGRRAARVFWNSIHSGSADSIHTSSACREPEPVPVCYLPLGSGPGAGRDNAKRLALHELPCCDCDGQTRNTKNGCISGEGAGHSVAAGIWISADRAREVQSRAAHSRGGGLRNVPRRYDKADRGAAGCESHDGILHYMPCAASGFGGLRDVPFLRIGHRGTPRQAGTETQGRN